MTIYRLLNIGAFLVPPLAFVFIDQLSINKKQLAAALFIVVSSVAAACFFRRHGERVAESGGIAGGKTLSSYVAGLLFLLLIMQLSYYYPVGGYLAKPLMISHSADNADAIFVLASGASKTGDPGFSGLQRVNHGIRLLKEGRARHLYLSTGFSPITGYAEAAWVASHTGLFELDPASFSILISPDITTTATEAGYARKTLAAAGANSILLVTSGAHIYRSCATFKKAGFEVLPAPVHNRKNIFYASDDNLTSLRAALHEWIGLIYYQLRDRI
ncbi:MAG: hypothetical protein CVV41_10890 [Candidatus Riflebacteria bacterium HGW-Riflebacteria-1]|jgi:uncharacterized SAM-binding protein YcdF (DUF218 family)|nr:MAG: hypothetical protein CVV41_10890 [Candidatus Riflebacteria bacterium HGW-Riflebacteria-1]